MGTLVDINGRLLAPEDATVSVFDRGFLYGDSVYEVVRTYQGRPFELEAHLERLANSGALIGLELPWAAARISSELDRVLEAAGNLAEGRESYARLMVTRGAGELGLDPALAVDPQVILIVRPLEQPPVECYREGVGVCIVHVRRTARESVDPKAKTGNYLNHVLALKEARARGAYEAIMLDAAGRIAEGTTSNVFVVRGGRVLTPPLEVGILEGVTRRVVLALARELGLAAEESELHPDDLRRADEAFITSTIREIVPVTRVDDAPLGSGGVGEVTRRIQAAFRARTGRPVDGGRF